MLNGWLVSGSKQCVKLYSRTAYKVNVIKSCQRGDLSSEELGILSFFFSGTGCSVNVLNLPVWPFELSQKETRFSDADDGFPET